MDDLRRDPRRRPAGRAAHRYCPRAAFAAACPASQFARFTGTSLIPGLELGHASVEVVDAAPVLGAAWIDLQLNLARPIAGEAVGGGLLRSLDALRRVLPCVLHPHGER